jgi:hypothetical protein
MKPALSHEEPYSSEANYGVTQRLLFDLCFKTLKHSKVKYGFSTAQKCKPCTKYTCKVREHLHFNRILTEVNTCQHRLNGVRSPKFIWAPCPQLSHWLRSRNQTRPTPRIWALIRGRYWSAKIADITLLPPILYLYPMVYPRSFEFQSERGGDSHLSSSSWELLADSITILGLPPGAETAHV